MDDDENPAQQNRPASRRMDIKELMPANPIYDKPASQEPKPVLRIQITKNQIIRKEPVRPVFIKQSESEDEEEDSTEQTECPFQIHYETFKCLYKRFNNEETKKQGRTTYFASTFIDKRLFRQNKEPLRSMDQLQKEVLGETVEPEDPKSLAGVKFDSNFQSGNLFAVYKKNPTEYDLLLQNDINSRGNTQWFYFTVSNLPQNVQVTFNIVNLLKCDSLFNYGMQPVVLSESKFNKSGESWSRQGRCVYYSRNQIRRQKSRHFYYTLSFKLTNKIANDTIHIAHCFPYTFTQLKQYLSDVVKTNARKGLILSRSIIGRSVGNNPIEVITITDTPEKKPDMRKIVVVMARQHPGEVQGSYVCEGVINYLLSKKGDWLRKNYVFKIIPMVNPDGVIFGNYRSNLMGWDLNRKWDVHDKYGCFPEVKCIKEFITQLNKDKRVKSILDLHGHSKKLNSFFYGNPIPQHPEAARGYPYTCAKLNPHITFEDCTFTIEDEKRRAARVYLSLKHNITNVFTFESSFYGYTKDNKKYSFGIQQFRNLGATLMQGLGTFLQYDSLVDEKALDKITQTQYYKNLAELKDSPNLLLFGDRKQSGSESNPQEYQVKNEQIATPIEGEEDPNSATNDETIKRQNALSTNSPSSKKGRREIKQMIRNTRQLKVMDISRVNSIFPDKHSYQLALEPSPLNPNVSQHLFDRRQSSLRQLMKESRISTQTQTYPLDESRWQELRIIDIDELQQKGTPSKNNTVDTSPLSAKFKEHYDARYVSLTNTRCKKNTYLKLESKPTKQFQPARISELGSIYGDSNNLHRTKNRFSQTILTSPVISNKFKSITHFPSVDTTPERLQVRQKQVFRTTRVSNKRDNQDFLNDMVRKYLLNLKQRTKVRPIISQQQRIFFERSSPVKIEELNSRPLSIQKKQIFTQKKFHCKSRS